jgi:hypothetical protein
LWHASTLSSGVINLLTFYPAIPAVEEKAKSYRGMVQLTQLHRDYATPFWTEEENIEMATRVLLRGDFSDLLGNSLLLPDLEALEWALFGVVYPCLGYIQRRIG